MYHDRYLEIKVSTQYEDECVKFLQVNRLKEGYDYSMFINNGYTIFKFYVGEAYEQCYVKWRSFALVI